MRSLGKTVVVVIIGIMSAVAASAAAAAPAASAGASWPQPADGVFTCNWIATHPAAAAHWNVGCTGLPSSSPDTSVTGAAPEGSVRPFANGCQWIPSATTYIGSNVYTWTTYEYANSWSWNLYTTDGYWAYYHWYLQKTDGTNYLNTNTSSMSGSVGVPANNYRWGAQNTSLSSYEQFLVCYQG